MVALTVLFLVMFNLKIAFRGSQWSGYGPIEAGAPFNRLCLCCVSVSLANRFNTVLVGYLFMCLHCDCIASA